MFAFCIVAVCLEASQILDCSAGHSRMGKEGVVLLSSLCTHTVVAAGGLVVVPWCWLWAVMVPPEP